MYLLWRLFFFILSKIFFSAIEVVGHENVPKKGPVVFVGNHQNQFVDPMLIVTYCKRRLGFLIAEKSMSRFIVGFFARQLGAIPIVRAIDAAESGPGTVTVRGTRVTGTGTRFKSIELSSRLLFQGKSDGVCIKEIHSDTELEIASAANLVCAEEIRYKILKKQDHTNVYEHVWNRLSDGECIFVFPEGGSHDRSELLPLKAGVTVMTLGAMHKHPQLQVQIVPCGLNYFSAHRFRSRVIIEFGKPYWVPNELAKRYARADKRDACGELLSKVEYLLRSVTITAADYQTLRVIHTARKICQPEDSAPTLDEYLDHSRRLASEYKNYKDNPRKLYLHTKITKYNKKLDMLGLQDEHVSNESYMNNRWFSVALAFRFAGLLVMIFLTGLGSVLNSPIAVVAYIVSKRQAKKALADSTVKIKGSDVIASYKLIIGLVMMPLLSLLYGAIVFCYFGFKTTAIFLVFWPFFSWASIRVIEEGYYTLSFLRVFLTMRWSADQLKDLRRERASLQLKLRELLDSGSSPYDAKKYLKLKGARSCTASSLLFSNPIKKAEYLSPREEIRLIGLRINESYEELEKALIAGED